MDGGVGGGGGGGVGGETFKMFFAIPSERGST